MQYEQCYIAQLRGIFTMIETSDLVRSAIVAALVARGESMSASELKALVSEDLKVNEGSVGVTLRRMAEDKSLVQDVPRGPYRLPAADEISAGRSVYPPNVRVLQPGQPVAEGGFVYPFITSGPSAGFPARAQETPDEYVIAPRDIVAGWTGGRVPSTREAYWTKIRGTSMEPWLPDGCPIFVATCDRVLDGGRYVIYLDDDDAEVVKRIERLGGGALRLVSDNPAHMTRTLRHLEDDVYEDRVNELRVRLRVRGVILYPSDTPHAILKLIKSGAP